MEARAALAGARRARRLSERELEQARALLERFWSWIDRIEPRDELVIRAGDLAEEHALRAYDAVHLALAESVADDETVLVSADRDLLAAAGACGIATLGLAA